VIVTSADGQWAAVRQDREVSVLAGGVGAPVGVLELDGDDVDLTLVGPPDVLVVVTRDDAPRVTLHQLPYLDAVARLDLDEPMRLAAVTGQRFALLSAGGKQVTLVRVAGRALSAQPIDAGSPAEFVVGLERNQFLLGLLRKLEVWDAVSGRPLLRLQLQLPPMPRTIGAAQGHLWATRPGTDEVFVYRLSDGRPFHHYAGSPVERVICHPASPLLVLVTKAGLVRLHCFAHSLAPLDVPWTAGTHLAQLVTGEDIALLGLPPDGGESWRAPIAGAGAPAFGTDAGDAAAAAAEPAPPAAEGSSRGMRIEPARATLASPGDSLRSPASSPPPVTEGNPRGARSRAWREPIAAVGAELARGVDAELPVLSVDNELGELAHRLHLAGGARRALIALYALYLAGEPRAAIARLAKLTADWGEPLGQGDLAALGMLRRRGGRVSLRRPVTDLLDGAAPREVRLIGDARPPALATPPAGDRRESPWGAFRAPRDGKSDAEIEAELAGRLGRIAIIEGDPDRGILEARLHGATAVAFQPPAHRPRPWPRDAALILVLYGSPTSWIADLPALDRQP
jgi:hypothetical protein